MKQKLFKKEQIVQILKEAEFAKSISEVCRKHGIADVTLYRWRARREVALYSAKAARSERLYRVLQR